jgi:hypothetical protein
LVEGVKQGLSDAWSGLMAKFRELAMQLPQPVRDAMGIKSPSTEMADDGTQMIAGLVVGLQTAMPTLIAQLGLVAQEMLLWGTNLLANITAALAPLPTTVQAGLDALVPPWAAFWATDNTAPLWAILFQGTGFWPRLIHDFESKINTWYTNGMDQALRGQVLAKLIAFMEEMKADVASAARDAGQAIGQALAQGLQAELGAVQAAAQALAAASRAAAGGGTGGGTGGNPAGGGPLRAATVGAVASTGGFGGGATLGNPLAGVTTLIINMRGGSMTGMVDSIETEAGYRQRATRRGTA